MWRKTCIRWDDIGRLVYRKRGLIYKNLIVIINTHIYLLIIKVIIHMIMMVGLLAITIIKIIIIVIIIVIVTIKIIIIIASVASLNFKPAY